jgi:hypothetical protein
VISVDHRGDKDAESNEHQPGNNGKPEKPGSSFGWFDQFFIRHFLMGEMSNATLLIVIG